MTPFGDYKAGSGLWNHLAITLIAEFTVFLAGTYFYARFTRAKNKIGTWMLRTLVVLLAFVQLAYWVDRNRELA